MKTYRRACKLNSFISHFSVFFTSFLPIIRHQYSSLTIPRMTRMLTLGASRMRSCFHKMAPPNNTLLPPKSAMAALSVKYHSKFCLLIYHNIGSNKIITKGYKISFWDKRGRYLMCPSSPSSNVEDRLLFGNLEIKSSLQISFLWGGGISDFGRHVFTCTWAKHHHVV